MLELKIEVDKSYIDGFGNKIEIMCKWEYGSFPYVGNYACDYNESGQSNDSNRLFDLIEEVKEK